MKTIKKNFGWTIDCICPYLGNDSCYKPYLAKIEGITNQKVLDSMLSKGNGKTSAIIQNELFAL